MKSPYLLFISLALFGCTSKNNDNYDSPLKATSNIMSRVGLPDESPYSQVKQIVGVDLVSFRYYSLKVNKRKILGNVIPYDKIWKVSDYIPLQLSATSTFFLNDKEVKIGKKDLSVYIIPKLSGQWTLILNTGGLKNGLPDNYDSTKNVVQIPVNPVVANENNESLSVVFSKNEINSVDISINWDNFKIPLKLRFDNTKEIFANVSRHLSNHSKNNEKVSWDEYMALANFCYYSNLKLEQGLSWIDSSITIDKNYSNTQKKAQILAKMGKYNDALSYYKQAYDLLKNDTSSNKEFGLKGINMEIAGLESYVSKNKNK
ncbi:DUF2911 domain-containing protein [Mucilaginibacter ginsenosidivorax]|uniref:DUF2911 domain-containing protein n=1 Tax=Mucilaginibacter ginsenosidivorax TaxID=862126 RepID=A0A5B8W865_9SPHI|nr:DUF2911 domain-containing protein [Mucilaginibacter ginsenosidivorax]QEC79729.1 DUF2911 domain-containing protein [Mucilaginibacter ginsenosidivorax]